jgi:hypothetical protein
LHLQIPSFGTGCLRKIPSSSGGNPRIGEFTSIISVLYDANPFVDKKAHFRNSHRKRTSCIFWVHKCSRRSDWICSVLFQLLDVDRQARIIRMLIIESTRQIPRCFTARGPLRQIRVQKERYRERAVQTACHNCARKGHSTEILYLIMQLTQS